MTMMLSVNLLFLTLAPIVAVPGSASVTGDWPSWRGPVGTAVAPDASPPTRWSETENVAWKAALPGHGKSTPIVHGGRIFLLAAVEAGAADEEQLAARELFPDQRTEAPDHLIAFLVLALDRKTGETLWETVVTERLPVSGVHRTNGYASFSPVAEEGSVYVSFGSYGVYALDAETGDVRWSYELGPQRTRRGWGEAGSPALAGDALIVVADQEDQSRIHALDKRSGEPVWIQDRDEPSTWTTPLVVDVDGGTQIVVNGTTAVRSYAATDGEVLWHCSGQTVNAIPTPVTDGELVVCASGYSGQACVAVPLTLRGDLRQVEGGVAWEHPHGTPYVSSPLLVDGRLYFLSGNSGILSCLDVTTGEVLIDRERLDIGNVYASPVYAGGRIYVVDREGTTIVLEHTDELEVVALNVLDEPIDATPVAVDAALFLRSESSLYAIGKP